ncbi:MAG: hypothetical protein HUU55_00775 [Myxococcales bacterium]|nr:hypothetical protein [Myxococcales bacterium]
MSDCPHRPECPGCPLIELPYAEQLRGKHQTTIAALNAYRSTNPMFADIKVHDPIPAKMRRRYRLRVKWVVDGSHIGLYGPQHHVVDTPDCVVVPEVALRIANVFRGQLPYLPNGSRLVALDIRTDGQGNAVPTLILEGVDGGASHPDIRQDGARLARMVMSQLPGEVIGVAVGVRSGSAATVLGEAPIPVLGTTELSQQVGSVVVQSPAGVFTQVHADQAALLQKKIREVVSTQPGIAGGSVVDLYAGTGAHGLAVSDIAEQTVLVESYEPAAEAAWRSAQHLPRHLGDKVDVWAMPVEEALTDLGTDTPRPWVVIANPPRSGLSADTLYGLIGSQPERIVMVSCDPETLARDMAILAGFGYRAADAYPIDMIPETPHIETVVVLQAGSPPRLPIRYQGDHFVAVDKPPLLPTIPHSEWPWSALESVRRDFPDVQPLHRLDVGTSGLVLFGDPSRENPIQSAQKTYLALVKGITHKGGNITRPVWENGREWTAHTRYKRVDVIAGHSLVEVSLLTGRTHQIRKHFAIIGHPVLGDDRYGDPATNRHFAMRSGLIRPFLHAATLRWDGGEITSPLWPDLQTTLTNLGMTKLGR